MFSFTINSFIFGNHFNDGFDVGTLYIWIGFDVDLVIEYEVWRRKDNF